MTDRDPHAHELEATGSRHPRGKTGATPAAGADDAQLPSGMLGCWIFLAVRIFSITAQFVGVAVLFARASSIILRTSSADRCSSMFRLAPTSGAKADIS